jgi:threonine synthase
MQFKSLNHHSPAVSFRDALLQSIAADGGLYVPESIPQLSADFIESLQEMTLDEIGTIIMRAFVDEIPEPILKKMMQKTFQFPIPLKKLTKNIYLLELFHGPTLAFKDVGARFMAQALSYFLTEEKKHITILVATSGDTGSAVAHGFYNVANVDVYILYPQGKISHLQEQQMTTLGGNIHAIEVAGTFDDCQALVKQSLVDKELKALNLTTANSINIGRLLPQIIYYFWGMAELRRQGVAEQAVVTVPSGNFGNITAAAYAKAMGASIKHLLAATNRNDVVPKYLSSGKLQPQASVATLSNAMDVGKPNNFVRLLALYNNQWSEIKKNVTGMAISDDETLAEIKASYSEAKIILDPHTAVGVAAARRWASSDNPIIVAATAHPGKFPEVIHRALGFDIDLPESLKKVMSLPKQSIKIKADFRDWKVVLQG